MNQLVGCFAKKRGQIRRLLSGFGREYVVNTAIRYRKFGPILDSITMFYNKIPDNKFYIFLIKLWIQKVAMYLYVFLFEELVLGGNNVT